MCIRDSVQAQAQLTGAKLANNNTALPLSAIQPPNTFAMTSTKQPQSPFISLPLVSPSIGTTSIFSTTATPTVPAGSTIAAQPTPVSTITSATGTISATGATSATGTTNTATATPAPTTGVQSTPSTTQSTAAPLFGAAQPPPSQSSTPLPQPTVSGNLFAPAANQPLFSQSAGAGGLFAPAPAPSSTNPTPNPPQSNLGLFAQNTQQSNLNIGGAGQLNTGALFSNEAATNKPSFSPSIFSNASLNQPVQAGSNSAGPSSVLPANALIPNLTVTPATTALVPPTTPAQAPPSPMVNSPLVKPAGPPQFALAPLAVAPITESTPIAEGAPIAEGQSQVPQVPLQPEPGAPPTQNTVPVQHQDVADQAQISLNFAEIASQFDSGLLMIDDLDYEDRIKAGGPLGKTKEELVKELCEDKSNANLYVITNRQLDFEETGQYWMIRVKEPEQKCVGYLKEVLVRHLRENSWLPSERQHPQNYCLLYKGRILDEKQRLNKDKFGDMALIRLLFDSNVEQFGTR
eukprot:TRINITY_DN3954_c0_g1_i3.p1 TRINITY_DN3954_c0_g1~~TRINITY_DN3954_c0_g1_i3.p1  ORF type:complete len:518 (+),score=47.55 TRINITY_DN3954_c0_g1_i3:64-1617(+)